jgi:hypothetical protein
MVERTEEEHTLPVQRPVYYVNEVLSETKVWYPQIQKLLYAVVLARRKLWHYFETHLVTRLSFAASESPSRQASSASTSGETHSS